MLKLKMAICAVAPDLQRRALNGLKFPLRGGAKRDGQGGAR